MHRIVIVGGGVAGLDLVTVLGRQPGFAISLIDAATEHVWKPMLHSIAAGTQDAALVGTSYLRQARRRGFTYVPGEATTIDVDAREVSVAPFSLHGHRLLPARRIAYDTLVLATGSVADPFGVPGVFEHGHQIDNFADAAGFQRQIAPRLAAAAQDGRSLSIAIVGGGATGVQLAAELVRIADTFDDLGLGGARHSLEPVLIDRGSRLLPAFPEKVSAAAQDRLELLGVAVRLDVDVAEVTGNGVLVTDGELIAADLTVWAAGVRASPLAADLVGVENDRTGRIVVDRHCRSADLTVFAIGDCAAFKSIGAEAALPPTAQVAYQQAMYLARHLPALIAKHSVPPFRYRDMGALVALGGYDAYGALGRFGVFGRGFFKGRVAQAGHAFLYRRHQWRLHGMWRMMLLWIAELARRGAGGLEKLR